MIGGNVFSIAFGRNLDAHAPAEAAQNATTSVASVLARAAAGSDSSHQCLQGRECYASSLVMTITACTVALTLSVYAGWRDWKVQKRRLDGPGRGIHAHVPGEVVWEEEE